MARLSLDDVLANCSPTVRALNPDLFPAGCPQPAAAVRPQLEHRVDAGPLAAPPPQAFHPGIYFVRVVSYRVTLVDEDNLCEKFLVDGLRYAALLPADSPDRCRIVTTQEKVAHYCEERTEIQVDVMPK